MGAVASGALEAGGEVIIAGGDHADVHTGVCQRRKHLGGDAGVRLHSAPDDRNLRQVRPVLNAPRTELPHRFIPVPPRPVGVGPDAGRPRRRAHGATNALVTVPAKACASA